MGARIVIHKVGHGQAIHVFTPKGEVIVIDLGCSSDFSPLSWLREQTSTIDFLIITHPHGDHIDEFLLMNDFNFNVRQFWRPKWLSKEVVYKQNQSSYVKKLEAYFSMSDRYNSPIDKSERVGNPDVSGLNIENFSSRTCGESNINNHSGVVFIEYENSGILIPGDNEPSSWKVLLEKSSFVSALNKTDIFMASHHGRESGYHSELFTSKPKLCVVSDGQVQETDATSKYSGHADGWKVHHRNGKESKVRNCLTTRSDGFIDIFLGRNNSSPYLSVTID